MARYIGPKTKIARKFGEPIFGQDKYFARRKYTSSQHATSRRRNKRSEYSIQLLEKQKLRYIYGVLERQCRKMFQHAQSIKGNTGEVLLQLFEQRLDNVIYRFGLSISRSSARQLISHGHIMVNDHKVDIPSYLVKPGDIVMIREKSKNHPVIQSSLSSINKPIAEWLRWNADTLTGTIYSIPERKYIPENINEQLIVEWYSK